MDDLRLVYLSPAAMVDRCAALPALCGGVVTQEDAQHASAAARLCVSPGTNTYLRVMSWPTLGCCVTGAR